ncbi:hypothetical protein [Flintibacter muris]|uniref:hypothetical protein n=1 Tax=Flintibacter muris TaxID=2941327 RepID=UPI00203AFF00|nr:hypothetical protein [Flintibacter muris]
MTYKVKINGKEYILPARTMTVNEQIAEFSEIDKMQNAGELTLRQAVEKIYAFVENMAPGAFPEFEETDTNELNKAAFDIIYAYNAPMTKAKIESQMSAARELLKNTEIQKLLAVVPMLNKK